MAIPSVRTHKMTKVEEQIAVRNVFASTVEANVVAGGHARWGNDESVSVIKALAEFAFENSLGFDAIEGRVAQVVNPSVFAQSLETLSDGSGKDKDGVADNRPAARSWIRRTRGSGRKRGDMGVD